MDDSKRYNTWTAKVGDRIIVREGEHETRMVVWAVTALGGGGVSFDAGPKVWAHVRPGGYGVTFDSRSYLGDLTFHDDLEESAV